MTLTLASDQIPDDSPAPPPSVWAAGDVRHTHEQIYAESPAGVQAANAPDPRDTEIMRLTAELAAAKGAPDPKDLEIARLRAMIDAPDGPKLTPEAPVEATATTVDPRDAELAQLRAEAAARTGD